MSEFSELGPVDRSPTKKLPDKPSMPVKIFRPDGSVEPRGKEVNDRASKTTRDFIFQRREHGHRIREAWQNPYVREAAKISAALAIGGAVGGVEFHNNAPQAIDALASYAQIGKETISPVASSVLEGFVAACVSYLGIDSLDKKANEQQS